MKKRDSKTRLGWIGGLTLAVAWLFPRPAPADPIPFLHDPIGPIIDVTGAWQDYQPAPAFCVKPEVFEFSGDTGATHDGTDPACEFSGFAPTDTQLYKVTIKTPILCAGCRRIFIDFSEIPLETSPPYWYPRGHIYFRMSSMNWTYTIDPIAHSPNIKNFTNDKLFAPPGSYEERFAHGFDLHAMSYAGDPAHFAHSAVQGPYYIGPWYVNRAGQRVVGAYLDLNVKSADPFPVRELNEIRYMVGFNSGEATCPDNVLFDAQYADGDYYYGGCVDRFGGSSQGVNPFP